jgi:hypothetical protein
MLFLLVAGVFCILAPSWILAASGMEKLEDEGCFIWGVRIFGLILIGVSIGAGWFYGDKGW